MNTLGEDDFPRGMTAWLSDFLSSDNVGGMFYGWRLVLIGILVILIGREIGDGLIEKAWGSRAFEGDGIGPPWNAVVIAGGVIGWLLSLWIAGRGVDRLGPKRMAQIGLPLVGIFAWLAALPGPGVLYTAMAGMTALGSIGAHVPAMTTLNNWFRDRLALALALMISGVAIGGIAVRFLLAGLLSVMDWRLLTVASGAAVVVVAWPLARAIRNRPEDWDEHPDGLAPAPPGNIPNYSWREAMRSRQFWTLVAAGCCVTVAETIASVYRGPIISQSSTAFDAINKVGLFQEYASIAGILAGGLASCRLSIRRVLSAAAIAQAVGIVLLLSGFGTALLEAAILLEAASGMGAAPAIAAVGIYFGRRNFGTIIVTTFLINQAVSSAVLVIAGYGASVTGGYVPMFVATAIVSSGGAGLFWMLGNPRLSPLQCREAEAPTPS